MTLASVLGFFMLPFLATLLNLGSVGHIVVSANSKQAQPRPHRAENSFLLAAGKKHGVSLVLPFWNKGSLDQEVCRYSHIARSIPKHASFKVTLKKSL